VIGYPPRICSDNQPHGGRSTVRTLIAVHNFVFILQWLYLCRVLCFYFGHHTAHCAGFSLVQPFSSLTSLFSHQAKIDVAALCNANAKGSNALLA